jgi:hypothetical protein
MILRNFLKIKNSKKKKRKNSNVNNVKKQKIYLLI